jgi:hypothetical protein
MWAGRSIVEPATAAPSTNSNTTVSEIRIVGTNV